MRSHQELILSQNFTNIEYVTKSKDLRLNVRIPKIDLHFQKVKL